MTTVKTVCRQVVYRAGVPREDEGELQIPRFPRISLKIVAPVAGKL
jgi:hypothetical protein